MERLKLASEPHY